MKRTDKAHDCVALKDKIQEKIYQEVKSLSHEEEIAYYRNSARVGPLAVLWKRMTEKRKTARSHSANRK